VAFLFSFTAHEASHALAAMRGGDLTAYHGGQVTLNPTHTPAFPIIIPVKLKFSGRKNMPEAKPNLIKVKVAKNIRKLAAGPAAAIQAARRG